MNWLLPIIGGFLLGRMATGETVQTAIQETLGLPGKLLKHQQIPATVSTPDNEENEEIATYG